MDDKDIMENLLNEIENNGSFIILNAKRLSDCPVSPRYGCLV